MSSGTDYSLQTRQHHYALSGKTLNDGRSPTLPKSKPQEAIDASLALIPTPSIGLTGRVREAEGGVYDDGIVLGNSVLVEGPQTAIITTDSIAVTAANNITCNLQAAISSSAGGIGLSINGNNNFGGTFDAVRALGAAGIAVEIKGTVDDIFVKADQVAIDGVGSIGYKVTSSHITPLDINCDVFKFEDVNQTFFEYETVDIDDLCDVDISSVDSDTGTPYAGSCGIRVKNGTLKASIGSISAVTAVEVQSGGTLAAKGNAIGGNTTSAGTLVYDSLSLITGDLDTTGAGSIQVRASNIIGDATTAGTGGISIICGNFVGEIVIGAGTAAFFIIDNYTGTLPVDPGDNSVRGVISGKFYGDWEVAVSELSGDTDGLSEGSTNLYYTEARVNANTNVAANTAKVTNATHTGDVTGSTALTLDSTAVTGQTLVTAANTDHVLISDASDSGNLKKALVSDMTGGEETIQVTFADTGNLATGDFMKIGEVICNGTPSWIAPYDYNIVKISISRTDTDASSIEVLVDGIVEDTIATAATAVTSAVTASIAEGEGLCVRNISTGNTMSNVIATLILERV